MPQIKVELPALNVKGVIYYVTHGDRNKDVHSPDPGITPHGAAQARYLGKGIREFLTGNPTCVIVGTSNRLLETCNAAGFKYTLLTPVVGIPDAAVTSESNEECILLANGKTVSLDDYLEAPLAAGAICLFNALPNEAIVVGSRLPDLDIDTSAAVYRISGSEVECIIKFEG